MGNDSERKARIAELETRVREASLAYHNGTSTMTDEEYDALSDELSELDAINDLVVSVGAPAVSEWVKVRHANPLGSLEKVNALEELTDWADSYASKSSLFVTEKLDGISISLRYVDGFFKQALTRGDGHVGEDITVNVARMVGVPAKLPKRSTLSVRGEIVMLKSTLLGPLKGEYENTRNAASGIAKRYDGRHCEHLVVVCYQVTSGAEFATEKEQFEHLESIGMRTPWWSVGDVSSAHNAWVEYQQGKRDAIDYEIDGLVVRVNDLARQFALGEKNLRPVGAVAFKFAPITRETVLRDIVWQTGSTGRITPVAIFDVVNLLGAQVTNASLYNLSYIQDKGIDVGARVLVARANDVIPRVIAVTQSTGTTAPSPATCATCGAGTKREGEYVVCSNHLGCPAQRVGRLSQWIKNLGILEWGETVLERLVKADMARNVADLYRLTAEQLATLDRMGVTLATKLIANLHASKTLPLELLLGSLSIPNVATSTVKAVIDAGYDDLEKIQAMTLSTLSKVPGLGPIKAQALHSWLSQNSHVLADLASVGVVAEERVRGKFSGLTFCFTGEMVHKRGDLENMVKKLGGEVKSSVTKKLTYLVLADTSTTKATKAKELGTKCLSEDEFVELVGA
jgi:DNA ligase (NAD+)